MSTELKITLVADSSLTASHLPSTIYAEKDESYKECIDSSTPDPAVSFYPGSQNNGSASCVPLGSGDCASEDTKYGLYLYINDEVYSSANLIGYCHFYKPAGEDWKSGDYGSDGDLNYPYVIKVTEDDSSDHNEYTCTVSAPKISITVNLKADSTLNSKGLINQITAILDVDNSSNIFNDFIFSPFDPDTTTAQATCSITNGAIDAKFGILFSAIDPNTGEATSVGSVQFEYDPTKSQWAVSATSEPENGYDVYVPAANSVDNFTVMIQPS
jgi:hypothetical protein